MSNEHVTIVPSVELDGDVCQPLTVKAYPPSYVFLEQADEDGFNAIRHCIFLHREQAIALRDLLSKVFGEPAT